MQTHTFPSARCCAQRAARIVAAYAVSRLARKSPSYRTLASASAIKNRMATRGRGRESSF